MKRIIILFVLLISLMPIMTFAAEREVETIVLEGYRIGESNLDTARLNLLKTKMKRLATVYNGYAFRFMIESGTSPDGSDQANYIVGMKRMRAVYMELFAGFKKSGIDYILRPKTDRKVVVRVFVTPPADQIPKASFDRIDQKMDSFDKAQKLQSYLLCIDTILSTIGLIFLYWLIKRMKKGVNNENSK